MLGAVGSAFAAAGGIIIGLSALALQPRPRRAAQFAMIMTTGCTVWMVVAIMRIVELAKGD